METREKSRISHLGKKLSESTKRKMSLAHIGKKHSLGYRHTAEAIKKISESSRNRTPEQEKFRGERISMAKKGVSVGKGRPHSIEHRRRLSESNKRRVLNGTHNLYKGGVTPANMKLRMSLEYKLWRESVFERDNWTCIWCKKIGGTLNADHIKSFSQYPELRFAIDNGRTLCLACHRTTDTFGWRIFKK